VTELRKQRGGWPPRGRLLRPQEPAQPQEVAEHVDAAMARLPVRLRLVPTVNTEAALVRIGHAYYR
jgi:hypothetical protein